MTNDEKIDRLEAIGKHVKLINGRYGYNQCPPELKESLAEVRAALADRVKQIIEA